MSNAFKLEAKTREKVGSRYAQRARKAGELPCVLYGHKQGPVHICVDARTAIQHFEHGEKVFTLALEGKQETALLKEIQFDYLGTNIIHADFERVDLDEVVETHLHIKLKGDPKGLDEPGAILLNMTSELTVSSKVNDIVESVTVDVSDLDAGDTLHAGDIKLPPGVELITDPDDPICSIQIQEEEEAVGEEAEVAGAEADEPEVISERKPEDEGAEEAADEES